jgi:hypothetical protein
MPEFGCHLSNAVRGTLEAIADRSLDSGSGRRNGVDGGEVQGIRFP